jgi:superfamily II DNA helicase RecQ
MIFFPAKAVWGGTVPPLPLTACYATGVNAVDLRELGDKVEVEDLEDVSIIFTSPETIATTRATLRRLRDRLCGIFVDECHCVADWYVTFSRQCMKLIGALSHM